MLPKKLFLRGKKTKFANDQKPGTPPCFLAAVFPTQIFRKPLPACALRVWGFLAERAFSFGKFSQRTPKAPEGPQKDLIGLWGSALALTVLEALRVLEAWRIHFTRALPELKGEVRKDVQPTSGKSQSRDPGKRREPFLGLGPFLVGQPPKKRGKRIGATEQLRLR